MIEHAMLGAGFAFAAALQPGPLQAFLLARVAAGGWRRTLPAALAPLISDGPIAILVLWVLGRVAGGLEGVLQATGGVVLLLFAAAGIRAWRRTGTAGGGPPHSAPRTLLHAVAVNLVNPGPWLGWSLILGPAAVAAWATRPAEAVTLVVAFYLTITACLAAFIILVGTTGLLGPRGRRSLELAAAIALAALGVYQLATL